MLRKLLGVLITLAGLYLLPAGATVRNVPADIATIQAAIDSSAVHDTVLVAPGTYYENINFRSKSIVVASQYLLDQNPATIAATIIDGSQPDHPDTGSVVIMISASDVLRIDSTARLEGFTIQGGTGTPLEDQANGQDYVEGGGILIEEADPVIRHNIIRNNAATRMGAGITSAGGGGIRLGFGRPVIEGNVIMNNQGRYGGGVVVNYADCVIRNNIIMQNSGGQDYGGGGLWAFGTTQDTTIADNNTICGNSSQLTGGGVRIWQTLAIARNNIVWDNRANSGASQISGTPAQAQFIYSDIQGGFTGEGNISLYPLFADSQLYLQPGSPCINTGHPDPSFNDLDGSRNDMGAYGGPYAVVFPPVTAPVAFQLTTAISFGATSIGIPATANFLLANRGSGVLRIDSIGFIGNAGPTITFDTTLTRIRPCTSDTSRVTWTPTETAPLADTMLIYHNDPAAANPLRVRLSGTVRPADSREPGEDLPGSFRLEQNYPNPFNAGTEIRFDLPQPADTRLDLFDLLGQHVSTLLQETLSAGRHTVRWEAEDLPSGTYIYRLRAGGFEAQKTMVLLK